MRTRDKGPPKTSQVRPVSSVAAKAIMGFSAGRRNAVRGTVAESRRGTLQNRQIDSIRNNIMEADMVAAATMLESPGGLRQRKSTHLLQSEIPLNHRLQRRPAVLEAAYACGFLNAWKPDAIRAVETIAVLSALTHVPVKDALEALYRTAQTWGASNYLVLKVVYVKEFFELDEEDKQKLANIEQLFGNTDGHPMLQYVALEGLKTKLSLFSTARRLANIFKDHLKGDFRRLLGFSNLVATPIGESDCSGFLLRGVESGLIDTVQALIAIANLKDRFPEVFAAVERNLDKDILVALSVAQQAIKGHETPDLLDTAEGIPSDPTPEESLSLLLFRRSIAFLEFPELCRFRNDVDLVIGPRLVATIIGEVKEWYGPSFEDLEPLKRPAGRFELKGHGSDGAGVDTFYRTYLFLRLIQNPVNLSRLTSDEVQYLFDNTMRLEMLLLETELKSMHLNASDEARAIISVLALSLYRSKSSDPDIDFDFRENLEDYIIQNFGGSIPDFIEDMAPKSPQVANYILSSLDEITLQKMYQIVGSAVVAESVRKEILTVVGVHLNMIEYIIEAEAIETRSKVAKVKNYFDASRMFVDSIAFKKWMGANESVYAEQYREMLPKLMARLSATKNIVSSSGNEASLSVIEITSTDAFLVEKMATDAFSEFCVNPEFGIESYLGRRIRHNTLHGVMTKSVDAVLQRPDFEPVISGTPFGRALDSWEAGFKNFIERMRKEFLQFRSEGRPNALFSSAIDPSDQITKRNLQQLIQTLRVSGLEMMDEMIIAFCWRQIAPQLEYASRQIRVKMTQDMTQQLDQALRGFNGPEELKVKSALQDAITSVFAQVAGWFQVPQTGFVPASIPEICNIIDQECGRPTPTVVEGELETTKYFGISVHRLYDCLAVLLQNAFKHGREGCDIVVKMTTVPIHNTNLHELDVAVRSVLPEEDAQECIGRVNDALISTETGRDMVTEGYSGIKKVKFITKLNEGESTVTATVLDKEIELRFHLKAEVVDEESEY